MRKETFNNSLKTILIVACIINVFLFFFILNPSSNISAGLYFRYKEVIIVEAENTRLSFIQEVFYHELGHHIWYTVLNKTEIEDYSSLVNETDAEEDFAGRFSIYLYGGYVKKEKYDFFEEMIDKYNLDLYRKTRR